MYTHTSFLHYFH